MPKGIPAFDPKKPYGTNHGPGEARYEQNGYSYDHHYKPVDGPAFHRRASVPEPVVEEPESAPEVEDIDDVVEDDDPDAGSEGTLGLPADREPADPEDLI